MDFSGGLNIMAKKNVSEAFLLNCNFSNLNVKELSSFCFEKFKRDCQYGCGVRLFSIGVKKPSGFLRSLTLPWMLCLISLVGLSACQNKKSVDLAPAELATTSPLQKPCCENKPDSEQPAPQPAPVEVLKHQILCVSPASTLFFGTTALQSQGFMQEFNFLDPRPLTSARPSASQLEINSPFFLNADKDDLYFLASEKMGVQDSPWAKLYFGKISLLTQLTDLQPLIQFQLNTSPLRGLLKRLGFRANNYASDRSTHSFLFPKTDSVGSHYSLYSNPSLFSGNYSMGKLVKTLSQNPNKFLFPSLTKGSAGISFHALAANGQAKIFYFDLSNSELRQVPELAAESLQLGSHFSASDRHYWFEYLNGSWHLQGQKIVDRQRPQTYWKTKATPHGPAVTGFKMISKTSADRDLIYFLTGNAIQALEISTTTGLLLSSSTYAPTAPVLQAIGKSNFEEITSAAESSELLIGISESGFLVYDIALGIFSPKALAPPLSSAFQCSQITDLVSNGNLNP